MNLHPPDRPSHPSHSHSRCGASDGELEELRQHGHRGEGEARGHGFLHHVGRRDGRFGGWDMLGPS